MEEALFTVRNVMVFGKFTRQKLKTRQMKNFTYATDLVEERLTNTNQTSQMPQYSPDGKKIAFFEK